MMTVVAVTMTTVTMMIMDARCFEMGEEVMEVDVFQCCYETTFQ
jgi:hypothetical protein